MPISFKVKKIRNVGTRKIIIGLFAIGTISGVALPFVQGVGAGSVSAATGTIAQTSAGSANGAAVQYTYDRIGTSQAYPLYITASFTIAGGLFAYALTYVPARVKARQRSQYASRVATWAKTTY